MSGACFTTSSRDAPFRCAEARAGPSGDDRSAPSRPPALDAASRSGQDGCGAREVVMKLLYATTLILAGSDLLFFHGGLMAGASDRAARALRRVRSRFRR